MPEKKMFNGRVYEIDNICLLEDARKSVKWLKEHNYYTRMVNLNNGLYEVWIRPHEVGHAKRAKRR